jgi:peptidoglycan/xylan/chitin deacetylase (PgdA/CDA1 family)
MLTQDVRLQRRLEHRRRVRRRRLGVILLLLLLVALGLGLFFGLPSGQGKHRNRVIGVVVTGTGTSTISHRSQARPAVQRRLTLPARLPVRTLSVPILMYHRIDVLRPTLPAITRALTVAPGDFASQMRWLAAHGFHTITQEQLFAALEHGRRLPARPVMITFDDGYRDVWLNAAPVMRALRMHGTAYVITNRVSGSDPFDFLSWKQLNDLQRDRIEIGSHTVDHAELPTLSGPAALQELIHSRHVLELHLHHPVQWFAYPAGRFDARTEALVRQAGYVLAVTTQPGSSQDAQSPFALHRYEVLDTTGVGGLASILGSR